MTQTQGWAANWSANIGREVKTARRAKHMTAEQLAERTKQLGFEVTRSAIANLESGRRDAVTVQQVAVLAMALDVSPVRLLFDPTAQEVDLLPGRATSGIWACEWWSGNIHTMTRLTDNTQYVTPNVEYDLMTRRKVFQLQRALDQAVDELDKLEQREPAATDTLFGLELDAARHRTALAATYLAGAVSGHKPWLPLDAITMLDDLATKGLFTWPDDVIGDRPPVEPWPGENWDG